ncbi:unnamed protein product [Euphydryas editha]|uniref:Uncharacterized protein n=1 Tax=Euphydryas editha TaxID=104508 RepID=A0AAU9U200_EUPED|nr:unnamed protein product [Euphydryas editha]
MTERFEDNTQHDDNEWQENQSDSDSSPGMDISPTPSPPSLPEPGESIPKEVFMRLIGLITYHQKAIIERKRNERRKRSKRSNKNEFIYDNYEMLPKRKKYNYYPYLQSHSDPPQTRSAKLRKQQNQNKSSREGSPSGSSSENKGGWDNNKPSWIASLPEGLSVEPVYSPTKKICHGCGRNDVPSLLVWCAACARWLHTGCGAAGRCVCGRALPEPAAAVCSAHRAGDLYRDKLAERKRLQEKNIELCLELRKLEARAATLKENLDEHNAEKRQLLADQIKTQRNLQKLLDFLSQFKDTTISIQSTSSASESSSEVSKSNEE